MNNKYNFRVFFAVIFSLVIVFTFPSCNNIYDSEAEPADTLSLEEQAEEKFVPVDSEETIIQPHGTVPAFDQQSIVGTYTIRNCQKTSTETIQVLESKFAHAQTIKNYQGKTVWDYRMIVDEDMSVYRQRVNIRKYDANDHIVEQCESENSEYVGTARIVDDYVFTVEANSVEPFITNAPGYNCAYGNITEDNTNSFIFCTNNTIVETKNHRMFRNADDYRNYTNGRGKYCYSIYE